MPRQYSPQVVFLMETKVSGTRMEQIRRSCGFQCGIQVGEEGSNGGLCISWKEGVDVILQSYSKNHIDVLIRNGTGENWRYTGFYGSPVAAGRMDTWDILRGLGHTQNLPWIVNGDFNEVMYSFEKVGGSVRDERRMALFQNALDDLLERGEIFQKQIFGKDWIKGLLTKSGSFFSPTIN